MRGRKLGIIFGLILLVAVAGCVEDGTSDYEDAPESIKDGELDYQDYKEAGCPYLEGSLDDEKMEKCNEWIRNQSTETE